MKAFVLTMLLFAGVAASAQDVRPSNADSVDILMKMLESSMRELDSIKKVAELQYDSVDRIQKEIKYWEGVKGQGEKIATLKKRLRPREQRFDQTLSKMDEMVGKNNDLQARLSAASEAAAKRRKKKLGKANQ